MKASVHEKTFIQALKDLVTSPDQAKKIFADRRITQLEKNIAKASLLIRDGKFKEVVDLLKSISSGSEVVESQRFYLLGSAYNNLSHFLEAVECYEQSYKLGRKYQIHFRDFSIVQSLIICYLNLKDPKKVKELCGKLKIIGASDTKEEIDLKFAEYYAALVENDLEASKKRLSSLKQIQPKMTEHQKILFVFECFDLAIKLKEFEKAYDVLEELKRIKKFYNRGSFKFMKALLDHLTQGKEIYLYEKDFEGQKEFLLQVKLINHLRSGQKEEANSLWRELMSSSPDVYKDNFSYHGDTCLFSLCLEKNLRPIEDISDFAKDPQITKEEAILEILKKRKGPVSKEEIFRLIYGREAESKEDMHKLTALVYLLRRKTNLNIKTQKGCYLLCGNG